MSLLAFAILCAQGSAPELAAREMGVPYDASNGFFELAAAQKLAWKRLEPVLAQLSDPKSARSRYQIRTELMTQSTDVVNLLQASRTKRISLPKENDNSNFSHLVMFLDKVGVDQRMATGDRRGGAGIIEDVISIAGLHPADETMARTAKQMAERHLHRIPVAETERLIKKVEGILASSSDASRTLLNLLKAALQINRFRWHYERLPLRVTDAGEARAFMAHDGKPYLYQVIGTGFRLVDGDVEFRSLIPEDVK